MNVKSTGKKLSASTTGVLLLLGLSVGVLCEAAGRRKSSTREVSSPVTSKVVEVFDKGNRALQSPPKSLRSDRDPAASLPDEDTSQMEEENEERNLSKARQVLNDDNQTKGEMLKQRRSKSYGKGFSGERILGVGFVGAGSYGVFGTEVDFGFGDDWAGGFGIGTGMSYSTWSAYARNYFKQGGTINTFFQAGYANWLLGKSPKRGSDVLPDFLAKRFLASEKTGAYYAPSRAHLIYPSIGALFQHNTGLAATLMVQYLISIGDFSGALYGSFGVHYYF